MSNSVATNPAAQGVVYPQRRDITSLVRERAGGVSLLNDPAKIAQSTLTGLTSAILGDKRSPLSDVAVCIDKKHTVKGPQLVQFLLTRLNPIEVTSALLGMVRKNRVPAHDNLVHFTTPEILNQGKSETSQNILCDAARKFETRVRGKIQDPAGFLFNAGNSLDQMPNINPYNSMPSPEAVTALAAQTKPEPAVVSGNPLLLLGELGYELSGADVAGMENEARLLASA